MNIQIMTIRLYLHNIWRHLKHRLLHGVVKLLLRLLLLLSAIVNRLANDDWIAERLHWLWWLGLNLLALIVFLIMLWYNRKLLIEPVDILLTAIFVIETLFAVSVVFTLFSYQVDHSVCNDLAFGVVLLIWTLVSF
jgi:hypothetical protein